MELACSPTIRHWAHESRNDGNRGHRNHFRLGGADVLRDLMFIKDGIDVGRQSGDRPMGTKNVVVEGMTLDSTLTPFTDNNSDVLDQSQAGGAGGLKDESVPVLKHREA